MTYTVNRDSRLLGGTYVAREGDSGSRVWVSARDAKRLEIWDAGVRVGGVAVGVPGQIVFADGAAALSPGDSLYPQDAQYICSGDSGAAAQYAGRYLGKWPLQTDLLASAGFASTSLVQDSLPTGTLAFGTLGGKNCVLASSAYANVRNVTDLTYRSMGYTICYSFYAQSSAIQQQSGIANGITNASPIQQDNTNIFWGPDSGSRVILKQCVVGAWEHYAMTIDGTGGTAKLYRNGILIDTSSAAVACRQRTGVSFQVNVGVNAYRNMRLYSKALSASEVAAVAAEDLA